MNQNIGNTRSGSQENLEKSSERLAIYYAKTNQEGQNRQESLQNMKAIGNKNLGASQQLSQSKYARFDFFNKEDKLKILNAIEIRGEGQEDRELNYDFETGADLRGARKEYLLKSAVMKEQGLEPKDNLCLGTSLMLLNGLV